MKLGLAKTVPRAEAVAAVDSGLVVGVAAELAEVEIAAATGADVRVAVVVDVVEIVVVAVAADAGRSLNLVCYARASLSGSPFCF
jgi:hypothetical protein